MIVGFDYWQTITRDPWLFGDLASAIISEGGEVHIISAVGRNGVERAEKGITECGVPYTAYHIVVWESHEDAPQLKLDKCNELNIQMFFDDRLDICELLNLNGILACNLLRKDNKPYVHYGKN
jgi:hypothetical protein